MILDNVQIAGTNQPASIRIADGKIAEISASAITGATGTATLSFDGATVFPGLINSHDHLDFNLFPQFGNKTYSNYAEWGKHIHKNYKKEITAILQIPAVLRSEWGVFKNLLCGVTTVINHGKPSGLGDDLITIFEEAQTLHSVHFERGWKIKLNNPFQATVPVNIHVGEGDDWLSFSEIDQLTAWNLLRRKLIGVHAVAMSENQAKKFEALVWCPQSNYFLLNKTARVNLLKNNSVILFGTDSTLTGGWDIWGHLRQARQTHMLSDEELYHTLNQNAAKTWNLNCGELAAGKDADIVVAKTKKNRGGFGEFFAVEPANLLLVAHKGHVRLFDETLLPQLQTLDINNFSKVYVDGIGKYVQGNLPGLMEQIKEYYADAVFPVRTHRAA